MSGRTKIAAAANAAMLSPTPSSPAPSSSSMNVGRIGTSIPTYTKNAPVAAVTARNGFVTRRGRGIADHVGWLQPRFRPRSAFAGATEVTRASATGTRRTSTSTVSVWLDGRADDDAADRRHVAVVAAPRHA